MNHLLVLLICLLNKTLLFIPIIQNLNLHFKKTSEVTKKDSGRGKNAGKGGVLGGIAGIVASIGVLTVPGVGVLAAAGPLATALSGVAIGTGGGGLIGALTGVGIPEEHAKEYEDHLNKNHIVVLVEADEERKDTIYGHFYNYDSLNTHTYPERVRVNNTNLL